MHIMHTIAGGSFAPGKDTSVGPETMEGGLCSIFFCANVPFILRQAGYRYVLIGESYIHGVMWDEVVDMWRIEMWRQKTLKSAEYLKISWGAMDSHLRAVLPVGNS
jgi:hypothetical protein